MTNDLGAFASSSPGCTPLRWVLVFLLRLPMLLECLLVEWVRTFNWKSLRAHLVDCHQKFRSRQVALRLYYVNNSVPLIEALCVA